MGDAQSNGARTNGERHGGSAGRRRGPRPVVGHPRAGHRDAARRPRRAGHEDRAAGRRPDPQLLRCTGLAPGQAQRVPRPEATPTTATGCSRSRAPPTSSSRATRPGSPPASASTTTRSTRSTRGSSTRSITAYGHDSKHSDRPGYDALVAARTGQQWESRGVEGGTIARLSGFEGALPGLAVPDDCWTAAKRPGPAVRRDSVGEHGHRVPRHAGDRARRCACASRPDAASTSRRRCSRACSPPPSAAGSRPSTPTPPTSRAG